MKETLLKAIIFNSALFLTAGAFASSYRKYLPSEPLDFKPPRGDRRVLENGLTVYILKDASLPLVNMTMLVKTGKIYDPKDKIGLAELTASTLKDGGTENYSPDEINKILEFSGASIHSRMMMEEAQVSMECLSKDFDKIFGIYAEILTKPSFREDKFKINQTDMLEIIRRRNDNPSRQAVREAFRMFYGKGHPYGWRPEISTVKSVTTKDLKNFHSNFYRPNNAILAVSGDFDSGEMLRKIEEKLGGWEKRAVEFSEIPPVKISKKRKIYLIDRDIAQTFIVLLQKGIKRHDDREFPLALANEILGGGLSSRLAVEIRSRRGLAYSVYSYFGKRDLGGYQLAFCGTKPRTYSEALSQMLKQFERMRTEPVGEAELSNAKDSVINSFVFRFPTPFDLMVERASYELYGYSENYLDNYAKNMSEVTASDVLKTAGEIFAPEDALILLVGDSEKFGKALDAFGEVTRLEED